MFRVRVTVFSGRFADVNKRHLSALSASSVHEIRAYQTCCFSRTRAHQKPVPLLSSSHFEINRLLASNVESFPVTPYGLRRVAPTTLLDMRGCMIEMLEAVSTIRLLVTPISTVMDGVPCSSTTETENAMTAFLGVLRRR